MQNYLIFMIHLQTKYNVYSLNVPLDFSKVKTKCNFQVTSML